MTEESQPPKLSHLDAEGRVHMVDVSDKSVTRREATASAVVSISRDALHALLAGDLPKGDALATARIAAIQAAKRTPEWIPLCHSIPLTSIALEIKRSGPDELTLLCNASAIAQTGVEMEALVGVTAAALTLYDMVKAVDKRMVIGPIRLERKTGGRSGTFQRSDAHG